MRFALFGCVALFVAFGWSTIEAWEYRHDEGFTFPASYAGKVTKGLSTPGARTAAVFEELEGKLADGGLSVYEKLQGKQQQHPPGYYVAAFYWGQVFGTGRFGLRLLGLAFGVASIIGVYFLGSRLASSRVGLLAAALLAACPWFHAISVFARPYSMAIALVIASTLAALACCKAKPSRLASAAFVLLSACGLYTLYHFIFVAVWHAALLFCWAVLSSPDGRVRRLKKLLVLEGLVALAWLPWLPHFLTHLEQTQDSFRYSGAYPISQWPAKAAELVSRLLIRGVEDCRPALLVLASLSALVVLLYRVQRSDTDRIDASSSSFIAKCAWWTLPLLPLSMLVGDIVHDSHTVFLAKYSFAFLPFIVVLIPAYLGWGQRPFAARALEGRLRTALTAAWIGLVLMAGVLDLRERLLAKGSMLLASEYVASRDASSHALIMSTTRPGYAIPLLLHLREQDAGLSLVLARRSATPADLFAELMSSDEGASVRRMTFLDFRVSYDPESRWSPADFAELERQARRAGWRTVIADPSRPIAKETNRERLVTVLSPVKATFLAYPE